MVRQGGFSLAIRVRGRAARERVVDGQEVVLAEAGASFEVAIDNDNRSTYLVRLFVDGQEAEPGYIKKLRSKDDTVFRGWLCRGRDVHEFVFARSPVDEHASSSSSTSSLGEVRAEIFATRRVRVTSSDSDSDDGRHRRSSASLGVQALPEKQAVKELGLQSRAGGAIERLSSSSRRHRGDYRLEKVKPAIVTLRLLYRDTFWFERHLPSVPAATAASSASSSAAAPPRRLLAPPTPSSAAATTSKRDPAEKPTDGAWWAQSARAPEEPVETAEAKHWGGARPIAIRAPGETARGPDGKRRRKDGVEPGQASAPDVVVLSD